MSNINYKSIFVFFFIVSLNYAQISVSIPEVTSKPESSIKIPINVSDLTNQNVKSYYFELNYDTDILKAKKIIDDGTLSDTRGWDVEGGYTQNGIYIYADGKRALKGSGNLIIIKFEILADEGSSVLELDKFYFNNGYPKANTEDGFFRVYVEKKITFDRIGDGDGRFSINNEVYNFPADLNLLQGVDYLIKAIPDANSNFLNWTGGINSTSNQIHFTVKSNTTISANFGRRVYNISAEVYPDGFGLVEGVGTYSYGENIQIKAVPFGGRKFSFWALNGEVVSNDSVLNVSVTNDKQYKANFDFAFVEVSATSNPMEAGSISGAGFYYPNQFVQLVANPNPNYRFVNWTEKGEVVSEDSLLTVFIEENKEFVANYSTVTEIKEFSNTEVPNDFIINNPYPNPFNPSTKFIFALAKKSLVNLEIYDINGKLVSNPLSNELLNSGYYHKTIDGNNLSSSIYFYRIIIKPIGGNILTKSGKLVLLK